MSSLERRLRFSLGRFRDTYLATPFLRPDRLLLALAGVCPLPDFLVIGAQKAGTSSFYSYLVRQPGLRRALRKEVGFFDAVKPHGVDRYRAYFPPRFRGRESFLTGEASPNYLFHPEAAERVAATLPAVKLIVILRNPIDRAFSHYRHALRYRTIARGTSFADTLELEKRTMESLEADGRTGEEYGPKSPYMRYSFVSRGMYHKQLQSWFKKLSRDRFLILRFEDLLISGPKQMRRTLRFLGVRQDVIGEMPRKNAGTFRMRMSQKMRDALCKRFAGPNRRLSEMLELDFGDWC